MSVKLDHFEKLTLTGTPDSICKIGSKVYACSNDGDTGYLYSYDLSSSGLSLSLSQSYSHTVKRITTDGNRIFAVSDLNGVPQIVRAYDPATLASVGNTYNMGGTIYGPIHVSTAGFILVQREWVVGVAYDNTRLLRFDGSAFMEITRFPARLAYHVIGLRILSTVVSSSLMGYLYYLGTDRTVKSTVNLPLSSGSDVVSKGASIISETRLAMVEENRLVLYNVSGEILDSASLSLSSLGRMVTDGRYLYISNETTPNISVYDTYDDKLRYIDSSGFTSGETGLTSVHVQNIVYGSNRLFLLSGDGLHSFTKSLAADFTISNPTPAVGETVTFEVI